MTKDALIRARAYAIWQAEGCPSGRDEQHWHQAAQEIGDAEAAAARPAIKAPVRRKRAEPTPPTLDTQPAGVATSPRRRKSAAGEPAPEPAMIAAAKPKGRRPKA